MKMQDKVIVLCVIIALFVLAGCATEAEKIDYRERSDIADQRFNEVAQYCHARGFAVNVECEAGRACQKYPNNREKLTAYCVRWVNTGPSLSSLGTISDRARRDMDRESRRRF